MAEFDISKLTGILKSTAEQIDKQSNNNGKIDGVEISLFQSEASTIKKHGLISAKDYNSVFNNVNTTSFDFDPKDQYVCKQDKTYVASQIPLQAQSVENIEKRKNVIKAKNEITQKLYEKWHSKWPSSPLTQSFFEKLYYVIDILNIEVPESNWNKEKYESAKEQAMDEVLAIFAGEAQLNPSTQKGTTYYGLFQLGKGGLTDLKKYAKAHPDEPGMNNISSSMTLNKFAKISGEEQLDYLIAYIGKCKEYSKIGKDEAITPAQLWAMIKWPFKGNDKDIINEKTNSITQVFTKNKVEHGIV